MSSDVIDQMDSIIDETPLTVFEDGAKEVLYSSAVDLTKAVSAITRCITAENDEVHNIR